MYILTTIVLVLFPESMVADIQNKISSAFDIFDHEGNKTVDVRSGSHNNYFMKQYLTYYSQGTFSSEKL